MTDTIIIGAGQAGLATAALLRRSGHEVSLLDAAERVGESWRHRWDSLRLFTPARHSALPGMPFPGPPGRYPGKDEVADYLEAYAGRFAPPVEHGTAVTRLCRKADGFEVHTTKGTRRARAVIVATGSFGTPLVPSAASALPPDVFQIHSGEYRNPETLPEGPVLVVGGGNSGMQIAAELASTRPVVLAVGTRRPAVPQRVLGVDVFGFLDAFGIVRAPADGRLGRRIRARDPLIGLGSRAMRRLGVRVTGRVVAAADGGLRTVGGEVLDPSVVVWATGFRSDFSWLDVPGALDSATGFPLHDKGVSPVEGLYYVGLPFQRNRGSALLGWVGEDARYILGRPEWTGRRPRR